MHGTETTAQPDDTIHIDIPQSDLTSFGDIDHNSLDALQSSGQWRNMQQVSWICSYFLEPILMLELDLIIIFFLHSQIGWRGTK